MLGQNWPLSLNSQTRTDRSLLTEITPFSPRNMEIMEIRGTGTLQEWPPKYEINTFYIKFVEQVFIILFSWTKMYLYFYMVLYLLVPIL